MGPNQRLILIKKLEQLRKSYTSETDTHKRLQQQKEIDLLEAQLNQILSIDKAEESIHISDVEAGRDITIGNQTHHHHYLLAASNWKKWLAFLLCVVVLLIVIKKYSNHSSSSSLMEIAHEKPDSLIIKVRDKTGRFPLKIGEELILDFGKNIQMLPIDKSGQVVLSPIPKLSNTMHIKLKTESYQAVYLDSSYLVANDTVLFLIEAKIKQAIKQSEKKNHSISIKTFQLASVSINSKDLLKSTLEEKSNWKVSKNKSADIFIEVGYSGKLEETQDKYYRYSGGFLQIKINNEICCCEDSLKIDLKGDKLGSTLLVMEHKLSKQIDQLINQHLDDVITKIKACAS